MFNNKSILITGATGSFGKEFVKTLLKKYKPNKVIIYSRDELKQSEMQRQKFYSKYKKILRFFIGDIRDKERLELAFKNKIDYVVHAAALKQVNVAEYNPFEFIKTNILGAQNLIDVCMSSNVKKVIALSTDKAVAAINLYGATKLASDKLFVAANNYAGASGTVFSVVRYGNVFGSRGSIIDLLLKSKNEKKPFQLTNKKMTRFNITLNQSVKFVLDSFKLMKGGEIFVPKIPSYRLLDLAKAVDNKLRYKIIGLRPGEKIHEEMITSSDSSYTLEYKNYFCILSQLETNKIQSYIKRKSKNKFPRHCGFNFSYNSGANKEFLSINNLKKLIASHTKK